MREAAATDLRVRYRVATVLPAGDSERVELMPIDDAPRWTIGRADMRIVFFLHGTDRGKLRPLDVVAIDVVAPVRGATT